MTRHPSFASRARVLPGLTLGALALASSAVAVRLLWLTGTGQLAASAAGRLAWCIVSMAFAVTPWWALASARIVRKRGRAPGPSRPLMRPGGRL